MYPIDIIYVYIAHVAYTLLNAEDPVKESKIWWLIYALDRIRKYVHDSLNSGYETLKYVHIFIEMYI